MPNESSFKLAFIGSHGVGKTTLCYGLAARLKVRDISLDVVHEVARRCPLPINEETGVAATFFDDGLSQSAIEQRLARRNALNRAAAGGRV